MVSGSSNPVETETAVKGSESTTAGSLRVVQLNGDELHEMKRDGTYWVGLRRCCENLGIDLSRQLVKLQHKSWATVGEKPTVDSTGKTRMIGMLTI